MKPRNLQSHAHAHTRALVVVAHGTTGWGGHQPVAGRRDVVITIVDRDGDDPDIDGRAGLTGAADVVPRADIR